MPDFWTLVEEALKLIWLFLVEYTSAVGAGIIAFLVALGSSYDKNTKTFNFVEGFLCGCIGVSLHPLLTYLKLPTQLAIFLACCVGFIGTLTVRRVLLAIVDRYITKQ